MATVIIGHNVDTKEKVALDVDVLVETRAALLATSGGGKTRLLRKTGEETHGKVQQVWIDWEGDLVTLAEGFDYLVAQKGGRIPVDIRSAALLAKKVLELNANIIIDLSELKIPERKEWVKRFLEALVHTPKTLWNRKCLVVIDEAHELCPEKGFGDSVAKEAVIDLMSLGRKRGLCGILASQRPARLSKDALTQCRNKFVGLCAWEVDRKKMASELGFTSHEKEMSLEQLDHEFYAVGPAISKSIIKIKAGPVKTRDLKSGNIADFKPMQSETALATLEQLKDLPGQAEAETRTMDDYKRKNSELQVEIFKLKNGQNKLAPAVDTNEIIRLRKEAYAAGIQTGRNEACDVMDKIRISVGEVARIMASSLSQVQQVATLNCDIASAIEEFRKRPVAISPQAVPIGPAITEAKAVPMPHIGPPARSVPLATASVTSDTKPLSESQKKILHFLTIRQGKYFNKAQLGVMTGFSAASGTFGTYLSGMKTAGYILQQGQTYAINPDKLPEIMQFVGAMQTLNIRELLEAWMPRLGGGIKKIYEKILEDESKVWDKEELAIASGFTSGASGTYGTYLSNLATLGLIERQGTQIRLNPELLTV